MKLLSPSGGVGLVLRGLALALLLLEAARAAPPVEAFAQLPLYKQMRLSPDGQRIAAVINEPGRTVLMVRRVDSEDWTPALASDKDLSILWAHWVNNERLLVSMIYDARRFRLNFKETRLFSVRHDGSGLVNMAKTPDGEVRKNQFQDRILDWLPEDGQHVLMQVPNPYTGLPTVHKVNVNTGARELVLDDVPRLVTWLSDTQHRLRLGHFNSLGQSEIRVREDEKSPWRTLWSFKVSELGIDHANTVWPLGFGADPQELYVQAEHEGRRAVFSVRLDQPGLPRTLRAAHPSQDVVGSLLRSPASGEVLGLLGAPDGDGEQARSSEAVWNAQWRARLQAIERVLPGRSSYLVSISRDEQRYLVYSIGNGQPGEFFLVDRKSGKLALVGESYPDLPANQLAGKQLRTITARDGLKLRAYLSLPRQRADMQTQAQPLPLVLLPHGGPQSRDDSSFDVETEFLASRGYAVLQVDFRGSAGYGRAFAEAGMKRWGMEMQDDLTDAVAWAVEQGIADPRRVCIVGGSYGGYAALMGLVKTPGLYRCAVSFAGVSDLVGQLEHAQEYGIAAWASHQIGWLGHDRKQLRATSPALHAARIEAPVLLVHGSIDNVVPASQSREMAKALKSAGKEHRLVELEGADHYFSRREDKLRYFQELEAFLARHLGAPLAESAPSQPASKP